MHRLRGINRFTRQRRIKEKQDIPTNQFTVKSIGNRHVLKQQYYDTEWGRVRNVKGNQEYRKIPMFSSWGLRSSSDSDA